MATILTIIPYKFYPPISGGALRCFYILREMAREHDVYLLTIQPHEDFIRVNGILFPENVKIISTVDIPKYQTILNCILPDRIADAINFRYLRRSLIGSASSYLLEVYPVLYSLLDKVKFELIYFENLQSLDLLSPLIISKSSSAIKLYDAHNVDSELWLKQAAVEHKTNYLRYAKGALSIERTLFKRVDAFFCCSEEDRIKLIKLNNNKVNGYVIPNGVALETRPYDVNEEKHLIKNILFCGSLNYFPNKEGLLWFYRSVFPLVKKKYPTITLTIIGNLPNRADYKVMEKDRSINLIGSVKNVTSYYQQSSVAIVPLLSGSGTRLKILEAMSLGNPVVTTEVGAEGINYISGEHLLVANTPEAFAQSILNLLSEKKKFNSVRVKAFELVRMYYGWERIGKEIRFKLNHILNKS